MAERRMFAKTIIDSDAFLDMPMSTQCLYFHLSMRADDEGFLNNPKKIQRMIGASEDDLRILLSKRFILAFDSGVIVIKHWKIHNWIRSDRITPTVYQDERSQLEIKDNGAYTTCQQDVRQLSDTCQPSGSEASPQYSIGKDSKGKDSLEEGVRVPRTATQIAEEVILDWSPRMQEAVREWLAYKKEKRQGYKETGLKSLLSQIRREADEHGEEALIQVIHTSMSSNYAGIVFDRLQEKKRSPAYASSGKQQALSADEWEEALARI